MASSRNRLFPISSIVVPKRRQDKNRTLKEQNMFYIRVAQTPTRLRSFRHGPVWQHRNTEKTHVDFFSDHQTRRFGATHVDPHGLGPTSSKTLQPVQPCLGERTVPRAWQPSRHGTPELQCLKQQCLNQQSSTRPCSSLCCRSCCCHCLVRPVPGPCMQTN